MLNILAQLSSKSHPELTKYPLPGDLIKTDEGRKIFQAVAQVLWGFGAAVRLAAEHAQRACADAS